MEKENRKGPDVISVVDSAATIAVSNSPCTVQICRLCEWVSVWGSVCVHVQTLQITTGYCYLCNTEWDNASVHTETHSHTNLTLHTLAVLHRHTNIYIFAHTQSQSFFLCLYIPPHPPTHTEYYLSGPCWKCVECFLIVLLVRFSPCSALCRLIVLPGPP